tara:strand:- start:452 stop:2008 length:1557 start_codon:yes stop_codon:yes gene_type:complete
MKVIRNFNLDTSNLRASGETRIFTINGDNGATFNLEIRNEDGHYYNFITTSFQTTETKFTGEITNNLVNVKVDFPSVGDPDQYDIYLTALKDTKHTNYVRYNRVDGTPDLNLSKGSNSKILRKVIYQLSDVTLTLSAESPSSASGFSSMSVTTDTFTVPSGSQSAIVPFTVVVTAHASKSFRIIAQPTHRDVAGYISRSIVDQQLIQGEDDFPAVTSTDTVDGIVSSGTKIVMDNNVADKMAVGDKVTGLSDGDGVTVVALNPDGDNVKEFSVSAAVDAADGATLSFTNQKFYRWNINNIVGLKDGMVPVGTNVVAGTSISSYVDRTTLNANTEKEKIINNFTISPTEAVGLATYANGVISSQTGMVTFNKQQPLALAGDTIKFYYHGVNGIGQNSDYGVTITDLEAALTEVTTTTTSAVSSSATIPVAEMAGIMINHSRISGIGVNPSAIDPLVTNKSGTNGAGNLTVGAAQTLENGQTFTFPNASRVLTITGNIKINAGASDTTLVFNLDNFIKAS